MITDPINEETNLNGLHTQCGLNAEQTQTIRSFENICLETDGVGIKFNYGMIAERSEGAPQDFLWYENGKLVGYAPLDLFGVKGEITAFVQPEFRNRSIFRSLYNAAVEAANAAGCKELLLVSYRQSASGSAAVQHIGLSLDSSEYCMRADAAALPELPSLGDLRLRAATEQDAEILSSMICANFPGGAWGSPSEILRELNQNDKGYYLAEIGNEVVGHIGYIVSNSETYIRGVGILEAFRGRGYGRQMLAETLRRQLANGATTFELDVATLNENALSLYKSCGFFTTNVYDYYQVPLK